MKNHRRRIRRLFSLLLAAMLAVEPAGTLPAVYAAEDSPETMIMTETDTVGSDHGQESGDSGFGEQGRGDKRRDRHGTHVAGIIGAKANGSMGVGVAPDVTLYSGNVYPTDQEQTLIL